MRELCEPGPEGARKPMRYSSRYSSGYSLLGLINTGVLSLHSPRALPQVILFYPVGR